MPGKFLICCHPTREWRDPGDMDVSFKRTGYNYCTFPGTGSRLPAGMTTKKGSE